MSLDLKQPITTLKGVGESVATKLERLGISTLEDLIKHYPRSYEDFSEIIPIKSMRPGPVTFRGEVVAFASRRSQRQRRLTIQEAIITDGTGTIKAIWFNQPYLARSFPNGTPVMVSGKLEFRHNDLALQSPTIEVAQTEEEAKHTGRIVAIYPETEGLTSRQIRALIWPLRSELVNLPEILPPELLCEHKLVSFAEALEQIHFPDDQESLALARRRLAFEELFFLMTASLAIKQEIQTEEAPRLAFDQKIAQQFLGQLDFKLTDAQRQAAWAILQDIDKTKSMNRLLEGDVGSGKTVVATLAAVMAIASDHQVALMVPTEILAGQHFAKIAPLVEAMGYRVALVAGKQTAAQKAATKAAIGGGAANLVIGTHALLTGDVKFHRLGLVIIDEQHRFGVNQRLALKQKAGYLPHLLSMTATPIPRSLALTIYGDLDISIIDTLPPGRKPVATLVVQDEKRRQNMYQLVESELAAGRQAFVICPLINDSDKLAAKSVTSEIERLQRGIFKHRRIVGLHGQMKPEEKAAAMERFGQHRADILVATSMVEVGIDIPNASSMVIENAERFGLAALHQLRGRVGRGAHKSYCFLVADPTEAAAIQRLEAMERSNDGFRLAQIDLEIRGPGQIYGTRQHGLLDLKLADISDHKFISEVRMAAQNFLQKPRSLVKYPYISDKINQLKAVTSLD